MKIWETDGYRKTIRDAVKEFAETNWATPREAGEISSDSKFQLNEVYLDGNKIKVDQI
jgi:hypothetical protein